MIAVIYEDVDQFGGEVAAPVARAVFDGLSNQVPLPHVAAAPWPRPSRPSTPRPRRTVTAPAVARGGLAPSRNPTSRRSFAVPEPLEHVDLILVASTVAVALLGVVMVYSATKGTDDDPTTYFLQRQAMFVVIGVGLMAAMAAFDYRRLRDWAIPIAGVALFLLFAVLTPLGTESKGIQAWFELAGFQLQPAELAKLALIIGLSAFLTLEQEDIDGKRLATILGVSAVPDGADHAAARPRARCWSSAS